MRMTSLNKGEYFRYNGVVYKKLEDREKGNSVENISTGEVYTLPLMLTVDKITEAEAKPKKKKAPVEPAVEPEAELVEPSTEPTEPLAGPSEVPPHPTLKPRTKPDIIVD